MADVDGSVLQPAQLQPEVEAQISPEVQPQDAPQDRAVSRTATPTIERNPSQKKPQNMNGPLYMQSAGNKNVRFVPRNRKQDDSALVLLARWFVENQIGTSHAQCQDLAHCVPIILPSAQAASWRRSQCPKPPGSTAALVKHGI